MNPISQRKKRDTDWGYTPRLTKYGDYSEPAGRGGLRRGITRKKRDQRKNRRLMAKISRQRNRK